MLLMELLKHGGAVAGMSGSSFEDCLRELVPPIVPDKTEEGINAAVRAIMEREQVKSTAFGLSVALPHARLPLNGEKVALNIGFHKKGIDLGASEIAGINYPDRKLTHVFFILLSSPTAQSEHLSVMARVARLVKMTDFLPRLMAGSGLDLYKILAEEEEKLP